MLGQVLFDDLSFEREYEMIPRDTYAIDSAGAARSPTSPFDRWRELGADALVLGSLTRTGTTIRVEMRLFDVRSRQQVLGREYSGAASEPAAVCTHTIADEVHQGQQRGLQGVARSKLTFSSDRDRRASRRGPSEKPQPEGDLHRRLRRSKPAAHHGESGAEHLSPCWSADGRSIA